MSEAKKVKVLNQIWIDGITSVYPDKIDADNIVLVEDYPNAEETDYRLVGTNYGIRKTDCEELAGEEPKFVTEKVSGVTITYVPNPEADKIDGKVPEGFTNEKPDSYTADIIDISEEPLDVKSDSETDKKNKDYWDEIRKELFEYWGNKPVSELFNWSDKLKATSPVIIDGVYQFDKEKLERIEMMIKNRKELSEMNISIKEKIERLNNIERQEKMQKPTDDSNVKYFIGADSFNDEHTFCLSRELNGSAEFMFLKSFDNKDEFKHELFQLSKIFKARIITENVIDFLNPKPEKIEITVDGETYFINRKAWELEQKFRKLRNQLFERQISQQEYNRLIEEL